MGLQDSSRIADLTRPLASARARIKQQGAQLRGELRSEFARRLESALDLGMQRLTRASATLTRSGASSASALVTGSVTTVSGLGTTPTYGTRSSEASGTASASGTAGSASATHAGSEPRSLLDAISTTTGTTATSGNAAATTATTGTCCGAGSLLDAIIAAQQRTPSAQTATGGTTGSAGTTGTGTSVDQAAVTSETTVTTSTATDSGETRDLVRIANEFAKRLMDIMMRASASGRLAVVPIYDPSVDQYGLTATDRAYITSQGAVGDGSVEQWVQKQTSMVQYAIQLQGLDGSNLSTRQLLALAEIATQLDASGRNRGIGQQNIDEVRALGSLEGVHVYSTQGNLDLRAQVAAARNAGVNSAS